MWALPMMYCTHCTGPPFPSPEHQTCPPKDIRPGPPLLTSGGHHWRPLQICSFGDPSPELHLVVTTEASTVCKWVVHILLECFLVLCFTYGLRSWREIIHLLYLSQDISMCRRLDFLSSWYLLDQCSLQLVPPLLFLWSTVSHRWSWSKKSKLHLHTVLV